MKLKIINFRIKDRTISLNFERHAYTKVWKRNNRHHRI